MNPFSFFLSTPFYPKPTSKETVSQFLPITGPSVRPRLADILILLNADHGHYLFPWISFKSSGCVVMVGGRKLDWASKANHLGGIPRKSVIAGVGAFAKCVAILLNSTSVHNPDTLLNLVKSRPPGVPLITISNHMSTYRLFR